MPTNTVGTTFQDEKGMPTGVNVARALMSKNPLPEHTYSGPANTQNYIDDWWRKVTSGQMARQALEEMYKDPQAAALNWVNPTGSVLSGLVGSLGSSFARNANRFKYELAKRELAKGASPAEVEATHGIFSGLGGDTALRHEIPDVGARLKVPYEDLVQSKKLPILRQSDIIEAPGLFEAFPEAKNSIVEFGMKYSPSTRGVLEQTSTIPGDVSSKIHMNVLYPWRNSEQLLSTLLHENTHAVQEASRFARGGSVSEASRVLAASKRPTGVPTEYFVGPEEVYLALAGEVEARTVQNRLKSWLQGRRPNIPFREAALLEANVSTRGLSPVVVGKGKPLTETDILKALLQSPERITSFEQEMILKALGLGGPGL